MAGNSSVSVSNLQIELVANPTDWIVAWSNVAANVVITPLANLYTNSILSPLKLVLLQNTTPANSIALSNLNIGNMWSDGNNIYVASNSTYVKMVTLSS